MLTTAMPVTRQAHSWTYSYVRGDARGPINNISKVYVLRCDTSLAWTKYSDKYRFQFYRTNGYLPVYPYKRTRIKRSIVPAYFNTSRVSDGEYRRGFSSFSNGFSQQWDANSVSTESATARKNANARLNSAARNQYYSIFETLYEGRKTTSMIVDAVKAVASAVGDVRHGRFTRAARTLGLTSPPKGVKKSRGLQDNWLEYRYGWLPLYSSVYGEMRRRYDHMKAKPNPVVSVSAYSDPISKEFSYMSAQDFGLWEDRTYGGPLTKWRLYRKAKVVASSKAVAYFEFTNPWLSSMTELGLTNPALLAWEALPLSFTVDWFLNVGQVLETFDAWTGKRFLSGTNTVRIQGNERQYAKLDPLSGVSILQNTEGAVSTIDWTTIDRIVLSSPPTIPLQFSNGLNAKRVLDAIALLKQRIL